MPLLVGSNEKNQNLKDRSTNYGSGGSSSSSSGSSSKPSSTSSNVINTDTRELEQLLGGTQLSDEEKKAITSVYKAVAEGDQQAAAKMVANLELAKAYADPMLARQLSLVTDQLTRTAEGMDYDLNYQETSLQNRLNDLRGDVSFQKDQLSIDLQQELRDLDTFFTGKLQDTKDSLAAKGFTSSSRRDKKEALLSEQKGGLVESANRQFGVANRNLDTSEERSSRDTSRELERLQNLGDRQKTDLARSGEAQIGTEGIKGLDAFNGIDTIGSNSDPLVGQAQLDYNDSIAGFAF